MHGRPGMWSDLRVSRDTEATLRVLAHGGTPKRTASTLDEKTGALVRVGALVAMGSAPAGYHDAIERARAAGATADEVVDTLVAVATTVGSARVVAASSGLAEALGYDIDAALEGRSGVTK